MSENSESGINNNNHHAPDAHRRGILIPELRSTLSRLDRGNDSSSHKLSEDLSSEENSSERIASKILAGIAVIAFVGPSGTGKSTRAIRVARENNIHYLIDDGLLINGSRIVAGVSAKKAATKMESVRQALFVDETRSEVMRRALIDEKPTTLMILGTSNSMLSKICTNLHLNQPSMLINIEDVSTEEERRMAQNTRITEGMHTIPVPSMEIKHEFSGYFSDPLSLLRQRFDIDRGVEPLTGDQRTVVRPTFSTLGSYSIADEALEQLISIVVSKIDGAFKLESFKSVKRTYGVEFYLGLGILYGFNAGQVLAEAQQRIGQAIEAYTAITTTAVNIRAVRLYQ